MVSPFLGKKIYLDASVVIYATEASIIFPRLKPVLIEPLLLGALTLVTSWITLTEVLIKPMQIGDTDLEMTYRQFLTPSSHFEILPMDRGIADQAASLRALHSFKIPDALHIATGMAAGCSHYITGDTKWAKTGLQVIDAASI